MSVNAILAMDSNMGIGYDNALPWPHNKRDMQWFRNCTSGHVVVMGRKTWESFGSKPLPNRINVVLTNRDIEGEADLVAFGDVEDVINNLKEKYPDLHIFIIGGANLYHQALPFCDKVYVTRIKGAYRCDTFMYSQDFEGFGVQEYIETDGELTIQIRSRR